MKFYEARAKLIEKDHDHAYGKGQVNGKSEVLAVADAVGEAEFWYISSWEESF